MIQYLNIRDIDDENDDCVYSQVQFANYGWDYYFFKEQILLKDESAVIYETKYDLFTLCDYKITLVKPDNSYEMWQFQASSELARRIVVNRMSKNVKYLNVKEYGFDIRKMAVKTFNDFIALAKQSNVVITNGLDIEEVRRYENNN